MAEQIPLLPRHRALADRLVAEGRYDGDWDVIAHAMSLLEDQERLREIKLAELKALIQEGLDDVERGDVVDGEEVFARLIAKYEAMAEAQRTAAE